MNNRLGSEPGLYLRQHAHHPVHWRPWGPEAFAEAKRLDKPVLVSVGYSSCHWCHVMARESFEDAYTADLMNRNFVCVKVDREERPDVDKLMMDAVTMITGRGGWPLNAFCLPDGRPFFGGTYFPPRDKGQGIIPWPQLLMRVAEHWKKGRAELEANAEAILNNLAHQEKTGSGADAPPSLAAALDAARTICGLHDDRWGGFGDAPKFPAPMSLRFLLAIHDRAAREDAPLAERIDKVAGQTLRAMACGGLFDQLGGGFHRYSTDARWAVPHFEKMLCDNGLLLGAYADAWSRRRNPLFRAVCEETAAWLEREMSLPGGGFAAALDADTGHHEGETYVWTPAQLREALGDADAKTFGVAYGVDERGNFEGGATVPAHVSGDPEERARLAPLRARLLAVRGSRPQPGRDEKVCVSWNALAADGLARAGWALGRKDLVRRAMRVSDFIWENLFDTESDSLRAVWYVEAGARHAGTLNDHAWLAEAELACAACAEWVEPGRGDLHLGRARRLVAIIRSRFADPDAPGYRLAAHDPADPIAARPKEWWDNATPAANASLLHVFATLAELGDDDCEADFETLAGAYAGPIARAPHGAAHALAALTEAASGLAVITHADHADPDALHAALTAPGRPPRRVFLRRDTTMPAGRFRVCVGPRCLPDADTPEEVAAALA